MSPGALHRSVWNVSPSAFPARGTEQSRLEFLVRYAVLAPSSHNSQPWRFKVFDDRVDVLVDLSRALPVADPDGREMYVSIGCALENLVVASERFGYATEVELLPNGAFGPAARVHFEHSLENGATGGPLFDAITHRRTANTLTADPPLDAETTELLREAADHRGAELRFAADHNLPIIEELVAGADEALYANPEYRREIADRVRRGALGDPWLRARISSLVLRHMNVGRREAKRDADAIAQAAAVGMLVTEEDGRAPELNAGRAFERIALVADSRGFGVRPMSQVLQVPRLQRTLSGLVGADNIQHMFRVGTPVGGAAPTPRFDLDDVLVTRQADRDRSP